MLIRLNLYIPINCLLYWSKTQPFSNPWGYVVKVLLCDAMSIRLVECKIWPISHGEGNKLIISLFCFPLRKNIYLFILINSLIPLLLSSPLLNSFIRVYLTSTSTPRGISRYFGYQTISFIYNKLYHLAW